MKKILLSASTIALSSIAMGQIDFDLSTNPNLVGVETSFSAHGDVDNDGDVDLIVSGHDGSGVSTTLYLNDGNGLFTIHPTNSFAGIYYRGDLDFVDLDNDNDLDLILIGNPTVSSNIAKTYINDGVGNFTESTAYNFPALDGAQIDHGDINGDNNIDLIFTGSQANNPICEIHIGNGSGVYTSNVSSTIVGLTVGEMNLTDIDSDGDLDVVNCGFAPGFVKTFSIYTNDGGANFTELLNINIDAVGYSSFAFGDIDNDGDKDLYVNGENTSGDRSSVLYTLNAGVYSSTGTNGITAVDHSTSDFVDFDNDSDLDLVITGGRLGGRVAEVYENDGTGSFSKVNNLPLTEVFQGSVSVADLNGDTRKDIFISGDFSTVNTAKIYLNVPPCTVNIPDANFKAYLVGNTAINTNGDSEIQCSEAVAFSGILDCTNMGISDLTGIEAFTSIVNLKCPNNSLTSLDVSANSSLIYLDCIFNSLTSLTLGTNTNLISVNFSWNDISSIDLSGLSALENLTCQDNSLTTLDISNNLGLTTLSCNLNEIPSLDLSSHVGLSHLSAGSNSLTSLNIANGNNTNFTFFGASSNPNLQCIQVDDVTYSASNWTSIDGHTSFSEDCQLFSSVEDNSYANIDLYPNPTSNLLNFSESIDQVQVFDLSGKLVLNQIGNFSQIDLTGLEKGAYLIHLPSVNGTSIQKIIKE